MGYMIDVGPSTGNQYLYECNTPPVISIRIETLILKLNGFHPARREDSSRFVCFFVCAMSTRPLYLEDTVKE